MGRRNRPFFRINAIEKRTKRDGKIIEKLGWYDPIEKNPEKAMKLDIERIKYWLSVGAQPSDTMNDILVTTIRAMVRAEQSAQVPVHGNAVHPHAFAGEARLEVAGAQGARRSLDQLQQRPAGAGDAAAAPAQRRLRPPGEAHAKALT